MQFSSLNRKKGLVWSETKEYVKVFCKVFARVSVKNCFQIALLTMWFLSWTAPGEYHQEQQHIVQGADFRNNQTTKQLNRPIGR